MQEYEVLPHTADTRLRVAGSSLIELFSAALEGMNCILKNDFNKLIITGEIIYKLEISSLDETMLLIDFLSEILTLSHKKKACYKINGFEILDNSKIKAVLEGSRIDGFDEDIKAVTYTEAKIIKNGQNQYETIIVFDI